LSDKLLQRGIDFVELSSLARFVGIVLTLLRSPRDARDLTLSGMARDHTLSMIALTEEAPAERSSISVAATTLYAAVQDDDGFSPGEFGLLKEWLFRLKAHGPKS